MNNELLTLYVAHVRQLESKVRPSLSRLGFDRVVLHSGQAKPRSEFDDQDWPLRTEPHFNHWAYFPVPGAVLELSADVTRLSYAAKESFWEEPAHPDVDAIGAAMDVRRLSSLDALNKEVTAKNAAFVGEDVARAKAWGFADDAINPKALIEALEDARVHKSAFEVECLREANRIAARGHRAVARAFESGERSELALHLKYLEASGQDAFETPYQNIVAIGDAGAVLHYIRYRAEPKPGPQSLLIDAGAQFLGYSSDITRTYTAGESTTGLTEFAELLAGMETLQDGILSRISVGKSYEALHDECHELLASVLRESGLAEGSDEALVQGGVTRAFLPHGLGHSLGLQTHDVGCRRRSPADRNPYLRNTTDISEGQVFTIEPGLYFIDALLDGLKAKPEGRHVNWTKVEALAKFGGIRIEDNILVTADGIENLTRPAFS